MTRAAAQHAIETRFPVGSTIEVFYNPRRPEHAVVERATDIFMPVTVLSQDFFLAWEREFSLVWVASSRVITIFGELP
jgi:hypothetical protein